MPHVRTTKSKHAAIKMAVRRIDIYIICIENEIIDVGIKQSSFGAQRTSSFTADNAKTARCYASRVSQINFEAKADVQIHS